MSPLGDANKERIAVLRTCRMEIDKHIFFIQRCELHKRTPTRTHFFIINDCEQTTLENYDVLQTKKLGSQNDTVH
jgi:hypothetical protein